LSSEALGVLDEIDAYVAQHRGEVCGIPNRAGSFNFCFRAAFKDGGLPRPRILIKRWISTSINFPISRSELSSLISITLEPSQRTLLRMYGLSLAEALTYSMNDLATSVVYGGIRGCL
jgi:hypothetical protein